ncbi:MULTISPECIES: hypothetical protein [Thermococcus]|uniref:Uncharacterized protein n=2 Tax=Thermococcus sibiricus TaxID=172049 RepID=C6A320_THESM|nr:MULTISPECIES: hypothetical protein [Thermococcus]KUK29378.1 MAG: Uncharacterized protein XD61_0024 [Thermococcus sp. 40_45]HII66702.1 hypothetical protein [Thermococcaceae archaeon]ACS90015.1 hypothetical protein TSIB_0957 [Thermococcus sibiricus MM 739]KUK18612.1 MAG: Uncharacterized protein XD54_0172 [Thermococcus sibiricus]MBC7095583.1 hypothetical protein [Thermococcus sp.]
MSGWKEILKKEGILEVGDFIIEVSIESECPCKDDSIYPAVLIYDIKNEEVYYLDESFEPVSNFKEALEQVFEWFERYINGEKPLMKRSPKKSAPKEVIHRFMEAIKSLK